MTFPQPIAGMVIRYAYLWRSEHEQGIEEGAKDRPCAVLLAVTDEAGDRKVIVLPIAHTPPRDPALAMSRFRHRPNAAFGLDVQRTVMDYHHGSQPLYLAGAGFASREIRRYDLGCFCELPADLFRKVREKWLGILYRTAVSRDPHRINGWAQFDARDNRTTA